MSSKAKPSSVNSLTVLKLSQSEFSEEPLDLAEPPPNWLQDGSVGALSVYNSQDSKYPSRYTCLHVHTHNTCDVNPPQFRVARPCLFVVAGKGSGYLTYHRIFVL